MAVIRRRYLCETGAQIVFMSRESIRLIPGWCAHVDMLLTRADAARYLRAARAQGLRFRIIRA